MEKLNRAYALEHNLIPAGDAYPVRVLQFGEGNFLRAFIDWFIDVMNEKTTFGGNVLFVQPTPHGTVARQAEQDFLWTLLLRGIQNGTTYDERRIISCVKGAIDPYSNWAGFLESARNPTIRFIFSNTTEAGIVYVPTENPGSAGPAPLSFPAKLVFWLYERYKHFAGAADCGCVIIPCELIESNGRHLKKAVQKHAADWNLDAAFRAWLDSACVFINTLVDRVVSGYPKEEASAICARLGYDDALLDVGEYFHLFVLEADKKYASELPFDKAGINAIWTNDVKPYRERKVRILNGAHTSVSLIGYLAGKETVREYTRDPALGAFLRRCVYDELAPTVPLPPAECKAFADAVIERFTNPFVRHQCLSIALNSVSKYKVRVLPSLIELTAKAGAPPPGLTFALAALVVFYRVRAVKDGSYFGRTADGREYAIPDAAPVLAQFEEYWRNNGAPGNEPALARAVLANTAFWGEDLNALPGLTAGLAAGLASIAQNGIGGALERL
ncbi:MAG: tagaturonate reductase [Spirochaetaceae bacterium]|nr:tagaturonate reductase [Spirochaetaceae bacterium]